MTPDESRDLLDGTTPGPWEWREGKDQSGEFVALCGPDGADALRTWDGDLYASGVHGTNADKALAAAAPTLAAMIAGMRTEYRAEYQAAGGHWFPTPQCCSCGSGWGTKQQAERAAADWKDDGYATRIIRRYVTEPEAADATD